MPTPIHLRSFADIANLDDEQVQEIIAHVGRDDLTIALKAADAPLRSGDGAVADRQQVQGW